MFNKAFSSPIQLPMLGDDEDTLNEATSIDGQTQDDILGEAPELIDLPPDDATSQKNVGYGNIEASPTDEQDPLSTSLHTVDSQPSMVLPVAFIHGKNEEIDADDLSFHASDVSMSELKEMSLTPPQKDKESSDKQQASMVDPELPLLNIPIENTAAAIREPEEVKFEKTVDSIVYKLQIVCALLVVLLAIDIGTSTIFFQKSPHAVQPEPAVASFASIEPVVNCTLPLTASQGKAVNINIDSEGVLLQYKLAAEAEIETYSWETIGATSFHGCGIAILTLYSLAKSRKNKASKNSSKSTIVKSEDYDLSAYQNLKYTELVALLRQRGCKTRGKKPVLVQRLVAVHKAELGTLTVVQLRKLLKAKNFTQRGRKADIIRTLVEAGI